MFSASKTLSKNYAVGYEKYEFHPIMFDIGAFRDCLQIPVEILRN